MTPEELYREDRARDEFGRVVTFSPAIGETPEGLFYLDRFDRDLELERALLAPIGRAVMDEVDARIEAAVLFGA